MQDDTPLTRPEDCADMAQLRAAIDDLDRRLVALLAVRQSYMDRAAILKTARDQVRDPARIEDVVGKVLAQAAKAGLSPAIAEPVWRTLIEQSIRHEFEQFDSRADTGETRLAAYGSLQPGQPSHHHLATLAGQWSTGTVRGTLVNEGWGASLGFPGLVLDPNDSEVAVQLFESADLPAHWPRLDALEGDGYRRVMTVVQTPDGPRNASIYVLA
jgi:chorismate mutase/gamma-glutamylcyclotransferase (GGCT)/AIG2-like uncharacterized protein YtfP